MERVLADKEGRTGSGWALGSMMGAEPANSRRWRGRCEWNPKAGWITPLTGAIAGRTSSGRKTAKAAYPLRKLHRKPEEWVQAGKSADWRLAIAVALKVRTTVTNRWLATAMHLGHLHEVSRKVNAWTRPPDATLWKKLRLTPNPKA